MTEGQLMKAVANQDPYAIRLLLDRYEQRVLKFLLGWVGNREDALDLTQEVMTRVCQKADMYNGKASLAAWIFRIARNLHTDYRRRKNFKIHSASVELSEFTVNKVRRNPTSPEQLVLQKETFDRVSAAIAGLSDRQREVVKLRLLGELSLEEIAETVGLSLGGVKSTLHNALKNLRTRLSDLEKNRYVEV
jgi:RNA polymerase sigma-70 factor (ECF subfamily)